MKGNVPEFCNEGDDRLILLLAVRPFLCARPKFQRAPLKTKSVISREKRTASSLSIDDVELCTKVHAFYVRTILQFCNNQNIVISF